MQTPQTQGDQGPALATITGQVPTVARDEAGQVVGGWRVTFRTRSGVIGSVFVPGANVQPDKVLTAVKEQATAIELVQGTEVR